MFTVIDPLSGEILQLQTVERVTEYVEWLYSREPARYQRLAETCAFLLAEGLHAGHDDLRDQAAAVLGLRVWGRFNHEQG